MEGIRVHFFKAQLLRAVQTDGASVWLSATDLALVLSQSECSSASALLATVSDDNQLLRDGECWLSEAGVNQALANLPDQDVARLKVFLRQKVFALTS